MRKASNPNLSLSRVCFSLRRSISIYGCHSPDLIYGYESSEHIDGCYSPADLRQSSAAWTASQQCSTEEAVCRFLTSSRRSLSVTSVTCQNFVGYTFTGYFSYCMHGSLSICKCRNNYFWDLIAFNTCAEKIGFRHELSQIFINLGQNHVN